MKNKVLCMLLTIAVSCAGTAKATSVIMEGDYIRTAVSDNGTLGYGNNTRPGIVHDVTGTGNFPTDDYLTPGVPWEIFSVKTDQTGIKCNNNSGNTCQIGNDILTDLSSSSTYDHYVNWTGFVTGAFEVSNDYFFNDGDERISIQTTITALNDLTNVSFARAIDPDQDSYNYHSAYTINGRGTLELAPEDWVHSEGPHSGLTLGLYSESDVLHNTGITRWTIDPTSYLAGTNSGYGDNTIGIGFNIGTLNTGESITLDYHYVLGDSLENVDIPNTVPAPGALLLAGLGTGIAGRIRRRNV